MDFEGVEEKVTLGNIYTDQTLGFPVISIKVKKHLFVL